MPDAQKISDLKERLLTAKVIQASAQIDFDRAKERLKYCKQITEQVKKSLKRAEREK